MRGETNLLSEQKKCHYAYHAIEFDHTGRAFACRGGLHDKGGLAPDEDLATYLASKDYRDIQRSLESCDGCNDNMMLCYYEPRLNFPIQNLIRFGFQN